MAHKTTVREHSFDDEKINIGVDFDGVIHKCSKGYYDGTIYDVPIEGSKKALKILSKNYKVVIFTAKAKSDRPLINGKNGKELVWEWLKKYGMADYVHEITAEKPRAVAYIDDKAIKFTNWNQTMEAINEIG